MNITLAAGGTGGHMIPAHALAEELLPRGHRVALITDDRGARIPACSKACRSISFRPAGWAAGRSAGSRRRAESWPGDAGARRSIETFLPPR